MNILDEHLQSQIAFAWVSAATISTLPHVVMRPRVYKDGDSWCALYGENLQDGVAGFGVSPQAACEDFDCTWSKP